MTKAKTKQFQYQFQDCVDKRFLVIKAGGCITVNKTPFCSGETISTHFVLERQHIYDSWNPIKSGHMQDVVCTLTNIWGLAQLSKPKFGKYEPT